MKKKDFMWNTLAGMINAAQSAIILIFISRGLGTVAAGIFTIGYALANLFNTIGKYAIRNYQVTDINEEHHFGDYFSFRIITVITALVAMAVYVAIQYVGGAYNLEKVGVVILLVFWKMVDAIEDVFYGMYQQHNRLDLGSKCYSIRLFLSTALYCVLVAVGISLFVSTAITLVFSMVVAFLMIQNTWKRFDVSIHGAQKTKIKSLFLDCMPLCIGTTLSIYVGNIPKYLIDAHMDETTQAYFGFLMMPAFVTLMLSGFIYHPMVRNFGVLWGQRDVTKIRRLVGKVGMIIVGFTSVVVGMGMWIGLEILSWLYGVDLTTFRMEFFILLVGGGVYALLSFLIVPLTSIRAQKHIAVGFFVIAVFALIFGKNITLNYGMQGVTVLYLVQNALLCLYFAACLFFRISKNKKLEE